MTTDVYKLAYNISAEINNRLNDFIVKSVDPYMGEEHIQINPQMIADAVKKQIPQKPKIVKMEYANSDRVWYPTFCPKCFENPSNGLWNTLIDKPTAYCHRCGQAIDWSEN